MMQTNTIRKFFGACALSAASGLCSAATVDLMILYDDYSNNRFNGDVQTAMRSWTSQMNNIYRASDIDIQLRLVSVRRNQFDAQAGNGRSAMSNALRVITNSNQVKGWRDAAGADFVIQLHRTGSCGVGWKSVNANYAFNITGPQCGPYTAIHELGHNMGLGHSRRQGDTGGTRYRYGLGYGVDNRFSTIMAYASSFNTRRIGRFSNADQTYQGLRLGVPVGQGQESHAARALNNVRNDVANFRPSRVNTQRFVRLQHQVSGLYLNGQPGASRRQMIRLANNAPSNVNHQWREINRGNNYFSYQKRGTNFCMDANNGGTRGEKIYLWNCSDNNRNQHFRKANAGNGYFRLVKRNASSFAVSSYGNPGPGQNIILWSDSNANRYLNWRTR